MSRGEGCRKVKYTVTTRPANTPVIAPGKVARRQNSVAKVRGRNWMTRPYAMRKSCTMVWTLSTASTKESKAMITTDHFVKDTAVESLSFVLLTCEMRSST